VSTQKVNRKLTAMLSADVKGYSRLMGEDEVAAVETLEVYREAISTLIQKHRGRVVDSPGDNVLAEFASVVDAIECTVALVVSGLTLFSGFGLGTLLSPALPSFSP
jgi:adenylate cyclase